MIFCNALQNQARVVNALVLREVHTLYGRSKYGFVITMLQTLVSVVIIMGIRVVMHMQAPHGMEPILYLLTGFFVWNIFSDLVMKCMNGVGGNTPLLSFPQVHVMDLMIARVVFIFVMQVSSFFCLLLAYCYFVDGVTLVRPWCFLFAIIVTVPLGLGIGLIFSAIISYFPSFQMVATTFIRILFFTSGLIFPIDMFSQLKFFTTYNPLLQIIDLMRLAFSSSYVGVDIRYGYLAMFSLVTLCIGLAVERTIHKKMEF